ncbi:FG-GAP-like repeat-containing protein [Streptomyces sp. NPDC048370]|uniref:C40 family peptidase n=1 Tax=Streptomyces sp. NPDC048370 TaxID=3365540 RepID=UPI00371B6CF3
MRTPIRTPMRTPLRRVTAALTSLAALTGLAVGTTVISEVAAPTTAHAAEASSVEATSTVGAASSVGGAISRTEILARAKWWIDTYGVIYSQDQNDAKASVTGEKYRPDCSGFVSMAWRLPKKSDGWDRNTRDLDAFGDTTTVSLDSLQPGDAILGDGHVALFDKWTDSSKTSMWVYEEYSTGDAGRHTTKTKSSYANNGFKGLRYDKATTTPPRGKAEPATAYDQGDGTMRIYRWASTGSKFERASDYDSGSFHLSNVGDRMASGDVDGDGKDDVVMAYQYTDGTWGLYTFLNGNNSDGIWFTGGQFDLARVGGRLVLGDWNGDGKDEPAVAYDQGDGTMRIYRWTSTGSKFERATDFDSGSFQLSNVRDRMAAGDVDGDGKDDIVMGYQYTDGTWGLYTFLKGVDSDGIWFTGGSYDLARVGGRLVLGDWNGDGKAEPATAYDQGDGSMRIYRWTSTGSKFERASDFDSGSFHLSNVGDRMAAGDTNGDGKDDIVMAYQYTDGTWGLYTFLNGNNSDGIWFTGGSYDLGRVGGRLVLGDW